MSCQAIRAGSAADALRDAEAVRERCHEMLAVCERGGLAHFVLDVQRLADAADYVAGEVRRNYPSLDIPFHSRWRHFEAGGVDRIAPLLEGIDGPERARVRFDLAVTSALLDAGAGAVWRWKEPGTGLDLARSEGLGVASLHLFASGALSSDPARPLRADADGLAWVTAETIARAFQVDADNPLAGLDGRVALLHALGDVLRAQPAWFGDAPARIGNLFDHLTEGRVSVALGDVLRVILRGLGAIWPGRITIDGIGLGDVWPHRAVVRDDETRGLVPFHKLSQWLAYSLVEPMLEAGVEVTGIDTLTGLAEYRNGGLFIDLGVLVLRDPGAAAAPLAVGSELVVEWRALTVALLDRLAPLVWERLGLATDPPPLVRLLEGGTWSGGRRIAAERRPGGGPPIEVLSDGTVFLTAGIAGSWIPRQ